MAWPDWDTILVWRRLLATNTRGSFMFLQKDNGNWHVLSRDKPPQVGKDHEITV